MVLLAGEKKSQNALQEKAGIAACSNMSRRVAVIDIGSNTIKLLIGEGDEKLQVLRTAIEECRIGQGLNLEPPRLLEDAMERAVKSLRVLTSLARESAVDELVMVATSAVRDACNRDEFVALVANQLGFPIRILSGEEEASSIARGLVLDPDVGSWASYLHFDIGGGSLECNHIHNHERVFGCSLPLGAVRITDGWISKPMDPISRHDQIALSAHVRETLQTAGIPSAGVGLPLILTGGSGAVLRAVMEGVPVNAPKSTSPRLSRETLENLYERIAGIPMDARLNIPYLPANRADVLPAAILVLLSILDHSKGSEFWHSQFGLRHGVAAQLLGLVQ
jgi:exopolyphosphatase / guanosine-5'-triphosphate,3'-diphosphate pyrophosphatase